MVGRVLLPLRAQLRHSARNGLAGRPHDWATHRRPGRVAAPGTLRPSEAPRRRRRPAALGHLVGLGEVQVARFGRAGRQRAPLHGHACARTADGHGRPVRGDRRPGRHPAHAGPRALGLLLRQPAEGRRESRGPQGADAHADGHPRLEGLLDGRGLDPRAHGAARGRALPQRHRRRAARLRRLGLLQAGDGRVRLHRRANGF
mmetsp:Transcript_79874/g.230901  ORF Transcript_79874/g.230901 Transcript_79874/m.230901 type:complete len:202 (+) Transcript_79874:857-1462(+)